MQKVIKISEVIYREDLYPRSTSNPELVQTYAENLIMDSNGLLHSMGSTIGYVKDGIFYCCDDFQKQVFTKYLDIQREHYEEKPGEKQFRDALAQTLTRDGWKVSKEVYTSSGRIDILSEKDHQQMIIETKMSNLSNACSHALGQLLFYQNYYPGASLWLATPKKPNSTILSILSNNGVNYYE
jgi:hypothetical protein